MIGEGEYLEARGYADTKIIRCLEDTAELLWWYAEGHADYEKTVQSIGIYTVYVYAIGGDYGENGVFYIDSQRHGGRNYQITLLDAPNSGNINVTPEGLVTWSAITGTNAYAITITVEGEEYLEKTVLKGLGDEPSYQIQDYVESVRGKHFEITLQALGNGGTIISSVETTRSWN